MLHAFAALLLGAVAQQATAPFDFELPDGYPAFQAVDTPDGRAWVALHPDGDAQFELRHFLLASPGARADLVAENLRKERWEPLMRDYGHDIVPWEGAWGGLPAAGHRIDFVLGERARVLVQRIAVDHDHLVIATWEGGNDRSAQALTALNAFTIPSAWRSEAAPRIDEDHGIGPHAEAPPVIGHIRARVDARDPVFRTVDFRLRFEPADDEPVRVGGWRLPPGAELVEESPDAVHYRVSLWAEDGSMTPQAGLLPGPSCLSGTGVTWLAMPAAYATEDGRYAAPDLTLEMLVPPHLMALTDVPAAERERLEDAQRFVFARRPGGGSWPIFVVGQYEFEEVAEHVVALRRSAESPSFRRPVRFLAELTRAAATWLPAADTAWSALTFPGAGDLVLDDLLVFDEANRWFRDPLEASWLDGTRRTGLARKIGYQVFGRQLAGRGHGAVFLEGSLSEYAAWRLLEATGRSDEADAMLAFWIDNEQQQGELPRPLTRMPREDLAGARRLMSRGGLVWKAIEARAGRDKLDAVLRARVDGGGTWTTEDLRADLERVTEKDWLDWFRRHVYGRMLP